MGAYRDRVRESIAAALALGCMVWAASAFAQRQNDATQAAPAQPGVFLNLPEPYAGLACGATYRPDWKLSLDQIAAYAESQLSACDLAVTVATIEGDVSTAYDKIGLANTQNWIAWSAAAAFLPGPDDPAAEDVTARVRAVQARVQNARDGLRFLAKLTAVMQYPEARAAEPAFDTVPNRSAPGAGQGDNGGSIQQTPLSPPPGRQDAFSDTPATPSTPATPFGQQVQPGTAPSGPGQVQVACVTSTAWVLEPSPALDRGRMTIDDPVAGQALVWLSGFRPGASGGPSIHSFAACPGATPGFSPSIYTPLPGVAQGLTASPGAAPADAQNAPPGAVPNPPAPAPAQGIPPASQQD